MKGSLSQETRARSRGPKKSVKTKKRESELSKGGGSCLK